MNDRLPFIRADHYVAGLAAYTLGWSEFAGADGTLASLELGRAPHRLAHSGLPEWNGSQP